MKLIRANNANEPIKRAALDAKFKSMSDDSTTDPEAPKIIGLDYDKDLQHSIVKLDGPLKVGHAYTLTIDFDGILADDLAGFYRIRYQQPNSTEPT